MFVGRVRWRAAWQRPSSRATAVAVTVCTIMLATGCAAVQDAIGSDDDTEASVDDAAVATTAAAPVFEPDAYCALSHEADQLNASFEAFNDPAALEGFIGDLVGLLTEATPPPEVQAQFTTLRTAYVDLQTQLAASGYDAAVLTTSPILSDANVNAAITAVDQHDLALCGEAPGLETAEQAVDGTDSGDAATDPFAEALATGDFSAMEQVLATDVGRQAFIEGMTETSPGVTAEQAGCILDNSDIAVLAEMSMTPDALSDEAVAAFLATLETCGVPLSAFQTQ